MNWLTRALAEIVQMFHREQILWFDSHGILRDLDGRPIKQSSVSRERLAEARRRRK